eukprot:6202790-Pleurochrysis_carterae.AAC.2
MSQANYQPRFPTTSNAKFYRSYTGPSVLFLLVRIKVASFENALLKYVQPVTADQQCKYAGVQRGNVGRMPVYYCSESLYTRSKYADSWSKVYSEQICGLSAVERAPYAIWLRCQLKTNLNRNLI